MSVISVLAMMLLVLAGIVLLCLGVVWLEKSFPTQKYDERQQLVRGRGYRLAFWAGFGYFLAVIPLLVGETEGIRIVDPYLLVFGGFLLQNLAFHVYCLINHAELPFSQKPRFIILGYILVGVIWLINVNRVQQREALSLVGYGSVGLMYLMVSFNFLAMALLQVIQLLRREKE